MGILRGIAGLMIEAHQRQPFDGRLLQLGRQEIFFSAHDLERIAARRGFTPANASVLDAIEDRRRALTDQEFFGAFGFDAVAAADYSDFDGAELVYDMNRNDLPAAHRGAYDCVVDGGTMEHVFHAPNFLANVFELLRVGGRIVHVCPASNAVDHGFYSFSPCLFYEFYKANGWHIDACKLLDFGTKLLPIRMTAYDYVPPISRDLLDGYLRGTVHYTFFVATKLAESRGDRIPQQTFYQDLWDGADAPAQAGAPRPARAPSLLGACKAALKSSPAIDQAVRRYGLPVIRAARILSARRHLSRVGRRISS
jgi:SAM-dependent methyltransferase